MTSRVFVGLSGGVDSAVSAALLKEQGYDVVGAFIKIWQPEFLECTWKEDRLDAMRVCAALGIPFREIDLSEEYKKEVVDTTVADYKRGITPNPDVLCNRSIKFGHFLQWALREGAESIATGHYARIAKPAIFGFTKPEYSGFVNPNILLRGIDANKDQSYFLYRLDQADLARVLFPIGDMLKSDVRARAKRFGLPVAQKPDSQGLCFVGDVSMRDFLARFIKIETGVVVDPSGNEIGEHDGAALYTIGQRHGFSARVRGGAEGPLYVTGIDTAANVIRVSPRRDDAARREVEVVDMHWIGDELQHSREADVQVRYRESPVRARITPGAPTRISFVGPHIAAPGQSLVVYDGERCLGGGVLAKTT